MAAVGQGLYHGGVSALAPWRRLLTYRGTLALLATRSLKLRYRRSVFGFAWTLAYPALATLVLSLVFASVFPQIVHYPAYALVGVLAWHFFSVSCAQAMDALLGGAAVMRNVYVPSALFPLSAVAANAVNFLLCALVLPAGLAIYGASGPVRPLALVVGVTALAAFTAGTALALAAFNVFFRDVRYFFETLLLLGFYATPIVYPVAALPSGVARLLALNPLYWIVDSLRAGLGASPYAPTFVSLAVCASVGLGSLLLGWRLYVRAEPRFHLYW